MNIEFICDDPAVEQFFPPKPANKAVPDWYKDLPMRITQPAEKVDVPTIKHCMPVQDMLTAGYIIFNTYEFTLYPSTNGPYEDFKSQCPHRPYLGAHHHFQWPMELDGKNKHYFKIAQPWLIKTPPGYSCLLIQPFYHLEERFRLLPGIVDTDRHDMTVEIPGYLLTDQPVHLEPGEPLLQVIPFKRDEWTMTTAVETKKRSLLEFFWESAYRRVFHSKKSFK